jgi:hypothetical protein
MFTAALPLLELLGEDIRSLDMGVRNKEFLGSREERLGNFTVYVSLPPFLILEGVKDAKRSRPNFEDEPCRRTCFGLDKGSSGLKKLFCFGLFAGPRLQRREYSNRVHLNSPRTEQMVIGQRGKSVFATGLWPDAVKRNEGLLKPNDCRGLNNPRRSVFSI